MQSSVNSAMAKGVPGLIAGISPMTVDSYLNSSKQTETYTVTSADTTTTVTINGTAFTWTAGTGTTTAIATAVTALIEAGSEPVSATSAANVITIVADVAGTAFTGAATANCTKATIIANETGIPFGRFVALDDTAAGDEVICHLPQASTDVTSAKALGFAVHTHLEQALSNADNTGYITSSAVGVLRKGQIWVEVEDAVTAGGVVYVRYVAGAGENLGAVRSDADTSDAAILPSARFKTAASAGGLAIVEINLP